MTGVTSSPRSSTLWSSALVLPLSLAVLAGCGSDDSGGVAQDPTGSTSASGSATASGVTLPACGDIWKKGSTIPSGYKGCVDNGTTVKADRTPCASGQVLVTYAGKYYGAAGGPVNYEPSGLKKSAKYRSASRAC